MKPNRIILIRHGKSEGNENPGIYIEKPDYALELSETGLKQADDAGKELLGIVGNERVMFYISPFFRTRSTFERIARQLPRSQFDYREEPRLREQEWGHLRSAEVNKQIDAERDRYG
jgi:broad specificity phosphatase PhoE